jgi:hypothetical protein
MFCYRNLLLEIILIYAAQSLSSTMLTLNQSVVK